MAIEAAPQKLVHDPRLARIERDHALLGAAMLAGAAVLGSLHTVASVAGGWAIVAGSLWMWKRIAARAFTGSGSGGAMALKVLAKLAITFGGVYLAISVVKLETVPFLIGTMGLPVVCFIEGLRSRAPEPVAQPL